MKEQAKELMRQVEMFQINQAEGQYSTPAPMKREAPRPAVKAAIKPVPQGNGSKLALKKPLVGKTTEPKRSMAMATSNGKDRRS